MRADLQASLAQRRQSTSPCSGQRAKASRRMNSRWIAKRFQGNELRSYQRHLCVHNHTLEALLLMGHE